MALVAPEARAQQERPPRELAQAGALGAAGAHVDGARRVAVERAAAPARSPAREEQEAARFVRRQAAAEARLGLQLYRMGEDWRAVSALRRYQLLDGTPRSAYVSGLIIGQIYHRAGRPGLAAAAFEQAVVTAPDGDSRVWSYLLEVQQICAGLDHWVECEWRLAQLEEAAQGRLPAEPADALALQRLFAQVMLRRAPGHEALEGIQNEEMRARGEAIVARGRSFEELETRRPWLAVGLSAVLPGAGQLYNRQWVDALAAFGLNALFGAATYWSFARLESVPLGVGSALFLGGFYAGNLYNAYADAARHNARLYQAHFEGMQRDLWPRVGVRVDGQQVSFGLEFGWPGPDPRRQPPPSAPGPQEERAPEGGDPMF